MGCGASKGNSSGNAVVIEPPPEWPPKVDADELGLEREITLPESIYWDYVRPFTPTKDRIVVNKRCTTAFYIGHRVDLDETYLQRYERGKNKVLSRDGSPCFLVDNEFIRFWCLPVARGQSGTKQFRVEICCDSSSNYDNFAIDPEIALEKLRLCRQKWDEHMSLIPYPHKRLQACLEELASNGMCVSFLFDGNGTIEDVVKFHASVNPLALDGPVTIARAQNEIDIFPNTPIGLWVTRWLTHVMQELEGRIYMEFFEEGEIVRCKRYEEEFIVEALLDAGADASVFFEPLSDYPYHTISVLALLESASSGHGPNWEQGMSLHEVMRKYLLWFKRHEHIFGCVCGFQSILERLATKSTAKLRFEVGSWVECNIGCRHHHEWLAGVVTGQWIDGQPYTVALEEGGVYIPIDTDEYVRVPTLRFGVGDHVECNFDEGDEWVSGIVVEQWPESDKGHPYKILLPEEGHLYVVKVDRGIFIRAQSE
mmetsp:Transcript_18561/g.29135  ORF Transcript_18561/g.29135 Transcript_18561/m.29135 type:complete len:482 (-) Transcript_18561:149-1594(-)|eukprot:CAMPEP_0201724508 /NCGR_PEP_ID=MMETSP0593-20130828/8246_1 /ASSEMBLY_ACC=CAM_ASM_000672 /TAXON_ID=267983 /ORGANISM="Skeletonema japonicum, Strain CCMP2506" /LENGTH=481 /DNA_ID=CAMNT_0048215789 /DNA_START=40 /DNA_END=1485 /DNA_ORIENTATION=-